MFNGILRIWTPALVLTSFLALPFLFLCLFLLLLNQCTTILHVHLFTLFCIVFIKPTHNSFVIKEGILIVNFLRMCYGSWMNLSTYEAVENRTFISWYTKAILTARVCLVLVLGGGEGEVVGRTEICIKKHIKKLVICPL